MPETLTTETLVRNRKQSTEAARIRKDINAFLKSEVKKAHLSFGIKLKKKSSKIAKTSR